jgi:uncharacterized membrane-anchored protein YitT (DUF2179 family)
MRSPTRGEEAREEGRFMMLLDLAPSTVLIGLIPLLIVVPLIMFWAWMFKDMVNNDHLPSIFKPYWVMAFILLNIPAAIFYYYTVYRNR